LIAWTATGSRDTDAVPEVQCSGLSVTLPSRFWSPHDLRHRRISPFHRQGRTWAEIGALVGQHSLKVTSDTYTHCVVYEEYSKAAASPYTGS